MPRGIDESLVRVCEARFDKGPDGGFEIRTREAGPTGQRVPVDGVTAYKAAFPHGAQPSGVEVRRDRQGPQVEFAACKRRRLRTHVDSENLLVVVPIDVLECLPREVAGIIIGAGHSYVAYAVPLIECLACDDVG